MESKPYDHAFQYKDIPTVPETFADGVHLVTVDGSTLRIVFTASRSDAEQQTGNKSPRGQKATAARLVMPLNGFAELYNRLDQMVIGLEQQGLLKRGGGPVKSTVQ